MLFQTPLQIRPVVLSNPNMLLVVLVNELEKPYARFLVEKSVVKDFIKDIGAIYAEQAAEFKIARYAHLGVGTNSI